MEMFHGFHQSHEYLEEENMLAASANLVTIIINKCDLELPGSHSKKRKTQFIRNCTLY